MIYESLKLVEKGETIVRNIVLYSGIANPSVIYARRERNNMIGFFM